LAAFEGASLADRAEPVNGIRAVIASVDGWDQNGLKALTTVITSRPGYVAALFSAASPSAAVVARAADLTIDCAVILKKLIERFGGKGGGRPDLAQGGGLQASPEELVSVTRQLISPAV
jgi:alanyl-tRNA synthetase